MQESSEFKTDAKANIISGRGKSHWSTAGFVLHTFDPPHPGGAKELYENSSSVEECEGKLFRAVFRNRCAANSYKKL
jgi:hypothetical protein